MMPHRALLALVAAFAFAACAKKSEAPRTPASVEAADIDAASPLDRPYRAKGGEALDIDRLFEIFPLYLRPTYAKSDFDKKTGATVVADLEFGGEKGFRVKRAEFYGVDLDRIERVKSAENAALDAPMEPVIAKLRLYDIESVDGDEPGGVTIKAAEVDALRIRQGGVPKESAASGLAAFFNAFDVAGVYFKDVRATGADETRSDTGAAFDFEAADLRLVGVGGGRVDAVVARDVGYIVRQSSSAIAAAGKGLGPAGDVLLNGPLRNFIAPENQRVKAKSLEWRNISFAGLMQYGLKGERPPISARDLIDLGTARLVDTETFFGDKRVSIVPQTDISAMEFDWFAPSKIRAVTRGGVYDFTGYVPDTEEKAIAELKSRKLDRVKADSDLAFDWSAETGGAVFSTGFDSSGLADLDIDVALDGLELKRIEAARLAGARNAASELARLKRFSFVIADEQMLDAFYALSALQTGGEAKDVRAATPALMRLTQLELKRSNPRVASYIDALADFLEDGGTLEVKAEPETPVPLEALGAAAAGGPDAMAAAVNLTVTRKK